MREILYAQKFIRVENYTNNLLIIYKEADKRKESDLEKNLGGLTGEIQKRQIFGLGSTPILNLIRHFYRKDSD